MITVATHDNPNANQLPGQGTAVLDRDQLHFRLDAVYEYLEYIRTIPEAPYGTPACIDQMIEHRATMLEIDYLDEQIFAREIASS